MAEDQYIVIMMISLPLLIQIPSLNHETTPERRASGLSLRALWGWISLWDGCCCPVTKHARFLCPPRSPGVCANSCPLSWWPYLTISSSVSRFSSCPQSLPASGSFQMGQLFASGGQSVGVSASTSVLPMNIQDWFPLGWTGWISLQSKGLSRVFS